ncbi:MAG: hypothetical protein JNK87_40870 [Bryobacterales bacterium]|nr:hypothetical protein [Bryobacterales bacterium]
MQAKWLARLRQLLPITGRKTGTRLDPPLGYQPAMTPEQRQQWATVLDRLRILDPRAACILSLRFEEGFTREQVADRLRLDGSLVRSKEQAAVAWLRRQR